MTTINSAEKPRSLDQNAAHFRSANTFAIVVNEVWKPLIADPFYEVSSEGRVRRVGGKVLRLWKLRTGYLQVKLSRNRRAAVHRLVCESFHGVANGRHVNHINGIKDDPRADNLEWVTPSENMLHASRVLGIKRPYLGMFSGAHSTSKAVIAVDMVNGDETRYEAAMDAVREGFRSDCISRCCNGKAAHHAGRYWRFAEERT